MVLMAGPRQKLRRAYEHLDILDRELEPFEVHLSTQAIKKELEAQTGDYVWRIHFDETEAERCLQRVSVLAGDVVHNLRSALDHIVWTLSTADKERCQFPVFKKPGLGSEGFHEGSVRQFWSIPAQAKKLIEELQPYNRLENGGPEYSELWAIHDLDRIDKHPRLMTAVTQLRGAIFSRANHHGPPPELSYGQLASGKEIARLPSAAHETWREGSPQFFIGVNFNESPPLSRTLSARSQLRALAEFVEMSVIQPIELLSLG